MSDKIFLVTCDIHAQYLLSRKFVAFRTIESANEFKNEIEEKFEKFSSFDDSLDDICDKMNHEQIGKYIDRQAVPLEWKMQYSDFRNLYPELKLEENLMLLNPDISEIDLI